MNIAYLRSAPPKEPNKSYRTVRDLITAHFNQIEQEKAAKRFESAGRLQFHLRHSAPSSKKQISSLTDQEPTSGKKTQQQGVCQKWKKNGICDDYAKGNCPFQHPINGDQKNRKTDEGPPRKIC